MNDHMTPTEMRAYLAGLPPDKLHAYAERVMRSRVRAEDCRKQCKENRNRSPSAVTDELEMIAIEGRLRMIWQAIGREYRDRCAYQGELH